MSTRPLAIGHGLTPSPGSLGPDPGGREPGAPTRLESRSILIIEDDRAQRLCLATILQGGGFQVHCAGSGAQARGEALRLQPDLILLDYQLPDANATEVLRFLRDADCLTPVVIITGHASVELAVQLVKEGAENFLPKPVDPATLLALCHRILDRARRDLNQRASRRTAETQALDPFLGTSPAILALGSQVQRVLPVDIPILILGETGTGKTALARWMHAQSRRRDHAFVELNCAGLHRELLESELFGHDKGAYTGAVATKAGMMELAHRGTLFLDEIAEMDLGVQAKILKAIEERSFRHLGGTLDRSAEFRLIGATHHDLRALLHAGRFREDLFYRISTIQFTMPPLRERREDIPALARFFLTRIATSWTTGPLHLSEQAEAWLGGQAWPGNIRELRNTLERAILNRRGSVLEPEDFCPAGVPPGAGEPSPAHGRGPTLREVERQHILEVMTRLAFQAGPAAAELGIPLSSLYVKLKQYAIATSRRVHRWAV